MAEPPAKQTPRASPASRDQTSQRPIRQRRRRRAEASHDREIKPAGWIAYLTLILLTAACYAPIFQSGMVWSAYDQTERSTYQSMETLAEAWTLDSIRRGDPLTLTSYFLEAQLPLPHGQAHHAINLLLHLAAACIFLKVLEALKLPAAFSAAVVFALHPAVMQTIFWSGYREELVGLILILGALYFGIQNRAPRDYGVLVLLSALAFLLHPAALVLPLLLTLVVVYQNQFPRLKHFNHLLPIFCLALFIGVWTQSGAAPIDGTPGQSISRSVQNFFFQIEQALLPTDLALFHPPRSAAESTAGAQYTVLPIFLLVPFYVLILFNYQKPWGRSIFAGLTAYLLLSCYGLLGSGTFLDGEASLEDHLHYISLPILIALVVCTSGGIIARLGSGGRVLWAMGFTCFSLFLSGVTIAHSLTIGDRGAMWLKMSEQWPDAWIPKVALIETIQSDEESAGLLTRIEMINTMESIIELQPDLESIRIALARVYREDGQDAQALRHYRWMARQEKPEEALLYETAAYYETLGLTWDARTTRERIEALYNANQ